MRLSFSNDITLVPAKRNDNVTVSVELAFKIPAAHTLCPVSTTGTCAACYGDTGPPKFRRYEYYMFHRHGEHGVEMQASQTWRNELYFLTLCFTFPTHPTSIAIGV